MRSWHVLTCVLLALVLGESAAFAAQTRLSVSPTDGHRVPASSARHARCREQRNGRHP